MFASDVRIGLFTTTTQYAPVGFGFGRAALQQGREMQILRSLTDALIASTEVSNATLIGLQEEVPSDLGGALGGNPRLLRMPTALIDRADDMGPERLLNELNALRTFDGIKDRADAVRAMRQTLGTSDRPLEPLDRVDHALDVAFEDLHVQSLIENSGLQLVMNLPAPRTAENPALTHDTSTTSVESESDPYERETSLSERIWRVLTTRSVAKSSYSTNIDPDWWRDLMPFQRDGVGALIELNGILLADDMGLGKTVQAIAALRILRSQKEIDSALVVAPAGLLDQWRTEITRWAPELTAIVIRGAAHERSWQWRATCDVTLVSYDSLRVDAPNLMRLQNEQRVWDVVVLDEAQRIKNRNPTSDAAKRIVRKRSWALTGTPVENDEEDLASIMEFVDYDPDTPNRRFGPGFELTERHRELQLRRKKSDVLNDLPPKLETKLAVQLTPSQRISYDRAERDGIVFLKSLGAEISVTHVLELITRLKQICNADPRTKESSKLEDIRERLRELTERGHKALVFSQYANESSGVRAAANYLRAFKPLILVGDMPMNRRAEIISQFQEDMSNKVLILSLRAGGLGLNLQVASYVFHLDRWWNPAIERQAEDRTHRMGQTVKVNVFKYSCVNTIEQRIDQILERKRVLFDELVDDVSIDLSAKLSRDELLSLFELSV